MQMKKILEEKGSMAVYVSVVLLGFLIILSSIYALSTSVRKGQLKTVLKIKEAYQSDNKNLGNIYQTQLGKLQPPEYTFSYTGTAQTFTVPRDGYYKIEAWGAQGNNVSTNRSVGGLGAYTSGEIQLKKGDKLYIYVGEHRTDRAASFNCGSTGGGSTDTTNGGGINGYGGGGATDIRTVLGSTWNDFNSLKSRIMVAAGGGGRKRLWVSSQWRIWWNFNGRKWNQWKIS